jgi:NAD(P)-dependent dehydrogenase (short-subunit alcohol dehydrogenase family)
MNDRYLENKNALIHGAGGAIGGAIARAFARQGAKVFLAGRTRAKLEAVAADISVAGGVADRVVLACSRTTGPRPGRSFTRSASTTGRPAPYAGRRPSAR